MSRRTFVMYDTWVAMLYLMPNEKAGGFIKAISKYALDGRDTEFEDEGLDMAFHKIKDKLDEDRDKYQQKKERMAAAREKKAQESSQKSALKSSQKSTLKSDQKSTLKSTQKSTGVSVSDSVSNNPPLSPQGERWTAVSMIEDRCFPEDLEEMVKAWVKYKQERRQMYKKTGLASFLTKVGRMAVEYGDQNVVDVISDSMAQNYQGVVWDWLTKKKKPDQVSGWAEVLHDVRANS